MWVYRRVDGLADPFGEDNYSEYMLLEALDPDVYSVLDEIPSFGWASETEIYSNCRCPDVITNNLPTADIQRIILKLISMGYVIRCHVSRPEPTRTKPSRRDKKRPSKPMPKPTPKAAWQTVPGAFIADTLNPPQ